MGGQLGETLAWFACATDTGEHSCVTDRGQGGQGRVQSGGRVRRGARERPTTREEAGGLGVLG